MAATVPNAASPPVKPQCSGATKSPKRDCAINTWGSKAKGQHELEANKHSTLPMTSFGSAMMQSTQATFYITIPNVGTLYVWAMQVLDSLPQAAPAPEAALAFDTPHTDSTSQLVRWTFGRLLVSAVIES